VADLPHRGPHRSPLTVVFAALAVSRESQARTGSASRRSCNLRPLRTTFSLGNQQITAPPRIPRTPKPSSTTSPEVVTKPMQPMPKGGFE
jgi:hypothetical protein